MCDNNFYSMDKLVEFGMGIGIASQMAKSMNQSLGQTEIPGAGKPENMKKEEIYYAVINNKVSGPFSLTEMFRNINEKKVVKETYIWKPGMKEWTLAENVPEILRLVALTLPPVPKDC